MRFVRRYCSVKLYGLNHDVDYPRPDNPKQEQQDVIRRDPTALDPDQVMSLSVMGVFAVWIGKEK